MSILALYFFIAFSLTVIPHSASKPVLRLILLLKAPVWHKLFYVGSKSSTRMEEKKDQTALSGRSAGILMHITSLPGPAFIGDIGPGARKFAEFLHNTRQTVWQMLPVQPVGAEQGYSPYSSSSAMAGSALLISPEMLVDNGLLDAADIADPTAGNVLYGDAEAYKEKLLEKAFHRWRAKASDADQKTFEEFCGKEHDWLEDYALYELFKNMHKGKPWYKWPDGSRNRDPEVLETFRKEQEAALLKIKWVQMIFDQQWQELKSYCESLDIRLLGDVPIYVAHDSADVWSNRNIFTIDEDGSATDVAGVPPDLFNDEGQLWGMPLFNWEVLRSEGYKWWIRRFKKNFNNFHILRLDHFRGFSSYWSVPAGAATAKSGSWKPGPGLEFFRALQSAWDELPFVAEDLGEIDKPVYELRDELLLPGMNVLQFAFGDDMPESSYLPHNHTVNSIVYTGTHDNNTTVGWFKELPAGQRKNLSAYAGTTITKKNVSAQLSRLAYMSVSKLVIIPMQDVLSLDGSARMNMPASTNGNWTWRMEKDALTNKIEKYLKRLCFYFDRSANKRPDGKAAT